MLLPFLFEDTSFGIGTVEFFGHFGWGALVVGAAVGASSHESGLGFGFAGHRYSFLGRIVALRSTEEKPAAAAAVQAPTKAERM